MTEPESILPGDDDAPLTMQEVKQVSEILDGWLRRCRVSVSAYNNATVQATRMEAWIGLPAAILSAAVATTLFATLRDDPAVAWKVVTGVVALVATSLTAMQAFLRLAERAEQYREAARAYGRLRRRIEISRVFVPTTRADARAALLALADDMSAAASGKPNVKKAIWDHAEYRIKGTADVRGIAALRLRLGERLRPGRRGGRAAGDG